MDEDKQVGNLFKNCKYKGTFANCNPGTCLNCCQETIDRQQQEIRILNHAGQEITTKLRNESAGYELGYDQRGEEIEQLKVENESLKGLMRQQLDDKTAYSWMSCGLINKFEQALKGAI